MNVILNDKIFKAQWHQGYENGLVNGRIKLTLESQEDWDFLHKWFKLHMSNIHKSDYAKNIQYEECEEAGVLFGCFPIEIPSEFAFDNNTATILYDFRAVES